MESGFPVDLILFGMIAAFLVLRLRSILGRRTGFERSQDARAHPVGGLGGRVIDVVAEPVPPATGRPLPDAASPAGQTLARMQRTDRNFSASRFLAGAEAAFRIIVAAFAGGDRATLRPLLTPETFAAFESAIAAREAKGETQHAEVRDVPSAAIEQAALAGTIADITVRFVSDQVSVTHGSDGNPVTGTDAVTEIVDVWTFQRDLASADPAWRLARTA
jgi:predicted lipid-binding transport protein (Tim44 family)